MFPTRLKTVNEQVKCLVKAYYINSTMMSFRENTAAHSDPQILKSL